ISGLVGWTRTRAICCVSARPSEVHVLPPSVVFQTPSPCETLPRIGNSPVPTYTMSGFDSETPIAPMEPPKYLSVTGSHVLPPSVLLNTPPPVVPNQYSLGRAAVTAARGNERTDTGFRPPQGVWNGVTHISTERPNPARASRRRPGCVSEPQSLGIGIAGISIGFSVMDDFASAPRPVSARSPCLPCVFTSPKGTSRDAHTSPPSSVVTCSARNVPAGTVTDSQPTTRAPLNFPAQSKAEAFCPPCLPIIPAISPEIRIAG